MNIQILDSWLREYLVTNAKPKEIARCLALCGPSCEKVEKWGDKDWIYDIEVTTNRVDMMSVIGIAREAAAILPQFGYTAKWKTLTIGNGFKPSPTKDQPPLHIKTDPKLTHRVMAVVMEVEIGQSPQYGKDRLEAAGIRSLNNLVDVTNYIMTEIGHPTHVFDYDRLAGLENNQEPMMRIRLSKKGEKITTLDDKTYELPGNDIVIENGKGDIIDLPGIMGTANSVVTDQTKRIIFFIDNNDAKKMRATSMTLGIRTVAVTLNEKHVDPYLGEIALKRGIQLYQDWAKAKVLSSVHDHFPLKPLPKKIEISHSFIQDRLGVEVKPKFITSTLNTLGFEIKAEITNPKYQILNTKYLITIPSWRQKDIEIPEDIVEEIARIYGYHNLPSVVPVQEPPKPTDQAQVFYWERVIKYTLKHWGYVETYTHSLVSEEFLNVWKPKGVALKIKNPLSTEWEYLRTSLVPSVLEVLKNNLSLQSDLKIFELANVYLPTKNDLPEEQLTLILAHTRPDFYELKGTVEALGEELGVQFEFVPSTEHPALSSTVQANVVLAGNPVGYIGEISPELKLSLGLAETGVIAVFNFFQILKQATKNKSYRPIPKHPPIVEDLTFFNDAKVPAAQIIETVLRVETQFIASVQVVGTYENKLTLQVTYLDPEQNLTSEAVTPIRKQLVTKVENLGLKLQGEV